MKVKALIDGRRRDNARGLTLLGVDLRDAKEEIFVRMVCDGLAIGVAFHRAGFSSKTKDAPYNLWQLPRVQERASKILEARRSTGVVTLPQVTDMLQRVFAGAHAAEEFSAAHNAAFSLARLYGHVTDKSVIEHIRRPSRDPDAPSEQALTDWAASLPVVSAVPGFDAAGSAATHLATPLEEPIDGAPAPLLGPGPSFVSRETNAEPPAPRALRTPSGHDIGDGEKAEQAQALSDDYPATSNRGIDWLEGQGPDGQGVIGNGAPVGPVTGTHHPRAHTTLLGSEYEGTGTKMGEYPPIEELF